MSKKLVHLFWTSGWDSTYRLVELSREDVTVQPVYVSEMGRVSEVKEHQAMEQILQTLKAKPETKADILPIRFVKLKDIPTNLTISNAFSVIRKDIQLGMQYEFLSLYAATCPGIEIGCEGGEPNKLRMTRALMKYGGGRLENGQFVIDSTKASAVGRLVLGNLSFPVVNITEAEMHSNISKWGYEDVMRNTWFCHTPLHDEPCGLCRACEVKMQNNMEFLLPPAGQRRYHVHHTFEKVFSKRIAGYICRKIYFH